YFCAISGKNGTVNSRTATVGYTTDSTPPVLLRAFGSADLNTATVEFNEVLDPMTAQDAFNFDISTGGNSISIANPVLTFTQKAVTIQFPQTETTVYTVAITGSGISDPFGNTLFSGSVQFRSWASNACAGMAMEIFQPLSTADNNLATTLLA